MKSSREVLHSVALAACFVFAMTAHAVDGGKSKSEVELAVNDCKTMHSAENKEKLSACAKDVYIKFGLDTELKKDRECWPADEKKLLTISKCESARFEFQKIAGLDKPTTALAVTGTLLTGNTSTVESLLGATSKTDARSDVTLNTKADRPVDAKSSSGIWSSGIFIALVITGLALIIAIAIILYLLVRHKTEVNEFEIAANGHIQGLQSDIDALKKKLSATQASFEQSQALRKSEMAAQRIVNKSTEDIRLKYTRQNVEALESQVPNNRTLSSKGDFEEALSAAFRVLIGRNAPLPSGREFERVLANVEDKQVAKTLKERGLRGYRLLDSSGATNNLNPALFALQGSSDEWLIYPMPFAERTGMYGRWFDGFDNSKSMTAVRPAYGTDRGGAIELTSKGQLA